jgi:hypothetical protein
MVFRGRPIFVELKSGAGVASPIFGARKGKPTTAAGSSANSTL